MIRSEIRQDYFLDHYVIFTPGRAKRPRDIREKTILEPKVPCPFCRENLEKNLVLATYRVRGDWIAKVLKNKFPAVTPQNPKAYGIQEVIVETPRHGLEFAELSLSQLEKMIEVYADRTCKISQDKKIEYILVFKNDGGKAGATIFHAHSQIFASSLFPPDVMEELKKAREYQIKNGTCVYCDIIKKEAKGSRKIFADENVVGFCPWASAFHYEAWIFPRRHLDNVIELNKKERQSFSRALKKILTKINSLDLSYNFFMHQVIKEKDQHFYLKIQPRESIWGGIELGSGIVVNSVSPEEAARLYRGEI